MSAVLIDDVLDLIFQSCALSTLVTVAQASSRTYALALPRLVRKVTLIDARQAHGFLQFILRHGPHPSRFPQDIVHHVLELSLDIMVFETQIHNGMGPERSEGHPDYPCSQLAPLLAVALRGMTNIQRFELKCNTETAMKHSPDLAGALLSLKSLHSLTLSDIWSNASDALGGAVAGMEDGSWSPIRTLRLISPYFHLPGPASPSFDQFLSHLSLHLVNLNINSLDLSGLLSETAKPPAIFPNVLRLQISQCCVSPQEISSAFPNVVNLTMGPLEGFSQRPHRLAQRLFPHLISAKVCFEHAEALVRSSTTFGGRSKIRRLDFLTFLNEQDDLPNLLSEIVGLKSLYFVQMPVLPVVWWKNLVRTVPELVVLRVRLIRKVTICFSDF
ncbi:hypothetical protein BKA70DRAFT_851289 [Coprinopsis sp. MPI-PUGE-AT-0042]|nr:hypothetical protein BKA70DRAFT_851289 [Coprinopsis sp. MPI-PUGE-AT-0042]